MIDSRLRSRLPLPALACLVLTHLLSPAALPQLVGLKLLDFDAESLQDIQKEIQILQVCVSWCPSSPFYPLPEFCSIHLTVCRLSFTGLRWSGTHAGPLFHVHPYTILQDCKSRHIVGLKGVFSKGKLRVCTQRRATTHCRNKDSTGVAPTFNALVSRQDYLDCDGVLCRWVAE